MGIKNANIPKPNKSEVKKWLDKWNELEDCRIQEEAINDLFQKMYPRCNELKEVIIKCSILNDFYSTNIFKVFPVAKHIIEIENINEKLAAGDPTLVDEIANVRLGENDKEKYLYSFATKFCSHHNEEAYPIYDPYVSVMLRYFRNNNKKKLNFKNNELKKYKTFKLVLDQFKTAYGLGKFSFKEIDRYLWQAGKFYMPKNIIKNRINIDKMGTFEL